MSLESVELRPGTRRCFLCEASALGLDPDRFSDLNIEVSVETEGEHLVLSLAAEADVTLTCDRTLDSFVQRISRACRILLQPHGSQAPNCACDEAIAYQPLQRAVDVTTAARDTLLLAVPHRNVAPHARHLDLPRVFGAPEAGVAPHWTPLQRLNQDS